MGDVEQVLRPKEDMKEESRSQSPVPEVERVRKAPVGKVLRWEHLRLELGGRPAEA
jgi:hypothetical protein